MAVEMFIGCRHVQRFALSLLFVLSHVTGHVRFVCPLPTSPTTEQDLDDNFYGQSCVEKAPDSHRKYQDIVPGPFTIRWEEIVYHRDSPFRISLHDHDRPNSSCVLLDQIPHNNAARVSSKCKEFDESLGSCVGSTYYITITIPDVDCQNCYLKVSFIDIDHAADLPCTGADGSCWVYQSCASIRIRPTEIGKGQRLDSCQKYGQSLEQSWPYKPQEVYKAKIIMESQTEIAVFTYDVLENSLHYDIPIIGMRHVKNCTIYGLLDEQSMLFSINVLEDAYVAGSIVGIWRNLSETAAAQLTNNTLYVKLNLEYEVVHGPIKLIKKLYQENTYSTLRAHYTHQGWLEDKGFLASASSFISPVGPCAPPTRKYIAVLDGTGSVKEQGFGVIGMMFIETRVHILATFVGLRSNITKIVLIGPELAGVPSLDVPVNSINGSLSVVLEVPTHVQHIGKVSFFKKAVVKTKQYPDGEIVGTVEEGTMAVIENIDGRMCGLAGFKITHGRELAYSVALSNCDGNKSIKEVTLNGRARRGMVGYFLYNITDDVGHKNSSWFGRGFIKDISSETFMYLWAELLYVGVTLQDMQSNTREISGQILSPGENFCQVYMPNACPVTYLKLFDPTEQNPPHGLASFIIDRSKVIQYSILMMNLASRENILSAQVLIDKGFQFSIKKDSFQSLELMDNAYIASDEIDEPSPDQLKSLSQGKLYVHVSTTEFSYGEITGHISAIHRDTCSQPKILTVGEGRGLWSIVGAPFPILGLHTVVGDMVKFVYSDNETVYMLADKWHFTECNFTGALLLGSRNKSTATYQADNTGKFYFASADNCNSTPAVKLLITAISKPSAGELMSLFSCQASVYQLWRDAILAKYRAPNMEGTAIGATLAATVILIVIIVWDSRRNKLKETHAESFQKF